MSSELLALLREALKVATSYECWDCGIDEQPVWANIAAALEEHDKPVDAGWHHNDKGQLVGTVGTHVCLLYVQRVHNGYEWSYAPWRVSGVCATEEEAKREAVAAALHRRPL
jgi:hypothetical protein